MLGNGDRGLEQTCERHRPELRVGPRPGRERPRHPDRHPARYPLREEGDRLAGRRIDEGVLRKCLRCLLAPVDRDHPMLAREVHDHEAAAPDPGHERLGDAEHSVRGDRGVDGVAARAQDLDPGTGRFRVDARDRTAGADCNRLLRGLRCRRSHLARDQRSDNSDQRSED